MLVQMSQRLHRCQSFEEAIWTILDDSIALQGAEYGNIQLPVGDELAIVAQRGLPMPFLRTFRRVGKGDGSACGRALRGGAPVIVRDVEEDVDYACFRNEARIAGYRSVQSTPMVTGDGRRLGMVSTHFAMVHEPTPIEMETLQSYGAIAAEHAFRLLGDAVLAQKAEQMSDRLYAGLLDRQAS
jgi:GAF domain-containing protein